MIIVQKDSKVKKYTQDYTIPIGDIDYNKHVNGSRYEFYSEDSRMQILANIGIDITSLIQNNTSLIHKSSHFQFHKQRSWNDKIRIETTCFCLSQDSIEWHHEIYDLTSGNLAAKIYRLDSLELFEQKDKDLIHFHTTRSKPISEEQLFSNQIIESRILEFELRPNLSDRNGFQAYPLFQLFKQVEEVRWLFSEGMGLTLEGAKKLDCVFFTTESSLIQREILLPGEKIRILAFISDYKKIACNLKQSFFQGDSKLPFLIAKEKLLAVSPSRMTPRKIPEQLFQKFLISP